MELTVSGKGGILESSIFCRRTCGDDLAGDTWIASQNDSVSLLSREIDQVVEQLRDRLEASEQKGADLSTLLDGLEEGLAFIDGAGFVNFCNRAFERWAGRPVSSAIEIEKLFKTPRIVDALIKAQAGQHVTDEVELGDQIVLLSAQPHRSGAFLMLQGLTDEQQLDAIRRDFVANVSHELKTPLTSVVGFAEALFETELPPDKVKDFADRILANATRMRHLVNDLLDLSLVESGRWKPDPELVSVREVSREAWKTLPSEAGSRRAEIELKDGPDEVYVDPEAIRQILANLLDNAARYGVDDVPIEVSTRPDGDFIRVEIRDHGAGIPSVHLERVFERFYRVDPGRSRQQGGTGLGLAIVKHFVAAHGGEVGVESELGQGTSVWFTLPSTGENPRAIPG